MSEDVQNFVRFCEAIVNNLGSENERELRLHQVGCMIPYEGHTNALAYVDDTIKIVKDMKFCEEGESHILCITRLKNDNPVIRRERDGSMPRYHSEWRYLEEHVLGLMDSLSRTSYYCWDLLRDAGERLDPGSRPMGPRRDGSPRCKSGSIASGGKKRYCSCDVCF